MFARALVPGLGDAGKEVGPRVELVDGPREAFPKGAALGLGTGWGAPEVRVWGRGTAGAKARRSESAVELAGNVRGAEMRRGPERALAGMRKGLMVGGTELGAGKAAGPARVWEGGRVGRGTMWETPAPTEAQQGPEGCFAVGGRTESTEHFSESPRSPGSTS